MFQRRRLLSRMERSESNHARCVTSIDAAFPPSSRETLFLLPHMLSFLLPVCSVFRPTVLVQPDHASLLFLTLRTAVLCVCGATSKLILCKRECGLVLFKDGTAMAPAHSFLLCFLPPFLLQNTFRQSDWAGQQGLRVETSLDRRFAASNRVVLYE